MKKNLLLALSLCILGNIATVSADNDVITLDLGNPTVPATVDYTKDGYWTNTYSDENFPSLIFSPFKLLHISTGDSFGGTYWDGFTLSKNASTTAPASYQEQWGCMAGGGIEDVVEGTVVVNNELPYLVAYWAAFMEFPGNHSMTVSFDDDYLYEPQGVYIANHPQTYYHNKNGGVAKESDFVKLIIGGVDVDGNDIATPVKYTLAWMEEGELVQPTEWQWVDLSSLGEVKELYFTMESTDMGDWGINTPTYFCMDKLQVRRGNPSNISYPGKDTAKVYPTLFTDFVNVDSEKEIGRIQLCDLNGRVVYSVFTNERQYTIPTETLTQGVYVLKLTDGESLSVRKIIKK